MPTLLITGGNGFIGKNLVGHFSAACVVLAPRSYELNLTDAAAVAAFLDKHDVDAIIHCATRGGARGVEDAASVPADNLAMVENLLACKKPAARLITFGSGAQYDRRRDLVRVSEQELGVHVPDELYGLSKLRIARMAEQRRDMLCLTIFGCYGPHEKESRFPTYAVRQCLCNAPIIINRNVVFDYLYIDDLCDVIDFFLEHPELSGVVNVTPDESIDLVGLAALAREVCGSANDIAVSEPTMNFRYTGSNMRLHTMMPACHFMTYEEGVIKLCNSFV